MSRILVAVSSTQTADNLGQAVARLAPRLSAEALIVHVSRPSGGQMRQQEQAEGEAALGKLKDVLTERGVAAETLLLFSEDIARAILNTAAERECTMIVLGMTAKNIFARLLAGNVPVELIKSTKIPVLLLPPDFDGTL